MASSFLPQALGGRGISRAYRVRTSIAKSWTARFYRSGTTAQADQSAWSISLFKGELCARNNQNGHQVAISGRWLRDVCPCTKCRNQDTAQRRINVFDPGFADACTISEISMADSPSGKIFRVTFGDKHHSDIPSAFLEQRNLRTNIRNRMGQIVPVVTWNAATMAQQHPVVGYHTLRGHSGMATLMRKIQAYGFCFVDDVPLEPRATEQLLETIGPIRNTHYGGFYDFTSDLSSKDTAYTTEALEPHTDNTYFTEPAGLQALHLLSHTSGFVPEDTIWEDGLGGESSLVDGFSAAHQLFVQDPEAYKVLTTAGVYAHASGNDGVSIQPRHAFPTFSHNLETQDLEQVRWNNADRAGIAGGWDVIDDWYKAAAKFNTIVNDPKNQFWFQLKPGRLLLFNNWRVLHGRSEFRGKRRMCGAYINRDDFISKFRMTNLTPAEIAASTVTG